MKKEELARQLDDLDTRFRCALENMDIARQVLKDSGATNFEKHCDALYATQLLLETMSDELSCLAHYSEGIEV